MAEPVEEVERRIGELRATVRRSVLAGDRARANALRAELHRAERAWDDALAALAADSPPRSNPLPVDPAPSNPAPSNPAPSNPAPSNPARTIGTDARGRKGGAVLPVREQVHHALTLLSVPAAPKLLTEVYVAFHASDEIAGGRLTHLRRDEERSFRSAPYARPYYLCSTLTAEHLTPVRGLLAVSTWPLERRVIGPLSPRVDFLTAAVRLCEQATRLGGGADEPAPAVVRLLHRFAVNIPGGLAKGAIVDPDAVAAAARAELAVHEEADRAHREAGAVRAARYLDDAERLFGRRARVERAPHTDRAPRRQRAPKEDRVSKETIR